MTTPYDDFLAGKVDISTFTGFQIDETDLHPCLFPHQRDAVRWAAARGRGLMAMSFGLGKTICAAELLRHIHQRTGGKVLVVCPLGVKHQFSHEDGPRLGMEWVYCRTDAEVQACPSPYILTNYERVRDGDISPAHFVAVNLDEGSVLRSLGSKTYQTFLELFDQTPFRFVATATPSPNNYKEIIYYAQWLGVLDAGQALTRWFKRDSSKAGNLTLHPHHERDFWLWVASWALFVTKPSDLGYDDTGYELPPLRVHWHRIATDHERAWALTDNYGQRRLLMDSADSVQSAVREKRATLDVRVRKAAEIVHAAGPQAHWLLWHHLEDERHAICREIEEAVDVYGSQPLEEREQRIIDFSYGRHRILATKPEIAGSGCNFQRHCHKNIFVGVDFKFQDFIQAIHRTHRFQQAQPVEVHIIHTDAEDGVVGVLKRKWRQHEELVKKMTGIIKEYGLANEALRQELQRSIGVARQEVTGSFFTAVNNDCVVEAQRLADDSIDQVVTSIPFGNQYEYSASVNDFGFNPTNDDFWSQMDHLTPNLLRTLKPGRMACIHVKDRLLYGHQNGLGVMSVSPFSDQCVAHFIKHGFVYFGRITVVTDVVRENSSTYRLGWSENAKDGSKMGVGMPEYVLLFRKLQTDRTRSYADEPVVKSKDEYTRAQWQLDAASFWRSSGDRLLRPDEVQAIDPERLVGMETGAIYRWWQEFSRTHVYDYEQHVAVSQALEDAGRLPSSFMLFPPQAPDAQAEATEAGGVWTDVVYMRTLNSEQARGRQENHVCLARGSLVLTRERGYVPIEQVRVGEHALTHRGRWRPILAVQKTGDSEPIITLRAHGVPGLTLTPTHRLWMRKSDWVRERDGAEYVEPGWVEAQNALRGYVNLKLPDAETPAITDRLFWWVVGRWLADGHWDADGYAHISCGRHEADDLVSRLQGYAGALRDTGTSCQVRLLDRKGDLRSMLRQCGIGAAGKHLPPASATLPQEQALALLDGYLSGDGHLVEKRQRYMATSVSRQLLMGMALLAQRGYGAIASIYPGRPAREACIQGRTVQCQQEWVFSFDLPKPRRQSPFILDDGAWKKVSTAEDAGEAEVWNLRVAEDESFTAEGCIVKNCPLPFDIVERLIVRYSNPDDLILDPFGGLMTVPYLAVKLKRRGYGVELNPEYWRAGVRYCQEAEAERQAPTLFDFDEYLPQGQPERIAAD